MKEKSNLKVVVMIIALGLLILVSGVQAIELSTLKETVSSELSELTTVKSGSSSSLQENLAALPTMVGGC